ncbi:hypothetical protein [Hungatella hathewayi]|uniref:hypothetical protein n=1 Tax=Hungatella hathewayi TaxID=154046 RepID=UPI00356A8766
MGMIENYILTTCSEVEADQLTEFRKYIVGLSDGHANQICIFGNGFSGKKLYDELFNRLVRVDCFCDNSLQKQGYTMDGCYCINVETLVKEKEQVLVLVSSKYHETDIIFQLREMGFPYVVSGTKLEEQLKLAPPGQRDAGNG